MGQEADGQPGSGLPEDGLPQIKPYPDANGTSENPDGSDRAKGEQPLMLLREGHTPRLATSTMSAMGRKATFGVA